MERAREKVGAHHDPTATAKSGVRAISAVVFLCAVALIAWQVVDGASPDGTTVSAFLAGAIATMALAYPRSFVSHGPMKVHEGVLIMRIGDLISDPALAERDPAELTQVTGP